MFFLEHKRSVWVNPRLYESSEYLVITCLGAIKRAAVWVIQDSAMEERWIGAFLSFVSNQKARMYLSNQSVI